MTQIHTKIHFLETRSQLTSDPARQWRSSRLAGELSKHWQNDSAANSTVWQSFKLLWQRDLVRVFLISTTRVLAKTDKFFKNNPAKWLQIQLMVEWQTKNAQVAETRHTVQKRCGSSPNNYKSGSWRPNKSKFQSIVKSLRLDRSRAIKERDGGVRFCISRHCGGTPGCTVSNTDAGCSVFYLLFSRSIFSASKSSKDSIHFLDESVIFIFSFFPGILLFA